ncbi:MAG: hypothetical protein LBV47_02045 [Bacteroidales bacterium]|nr:hypothetical protein [Bacteroidales bacterium]
MADRTSATFAHCCMALSGNSETITHPCMAVSGFPETALRNYESCEVQNIMDSDVNTLKALRRQNPCSGK